MMQHSAEIDLQADTNTLKIWQKLKIALFFVIKTETFESQK